MMTRAAKAAVKAAKAAEAATEETVAEEMAAIANDSGEMKEAEGTAGTADIPEHTEQIGIHFNISGNKGRKALITALSEYLNQQPEYLGAANGYAYAVGAYRIDRSGTLIGEASPEMLAALAEQGFKPESSDAA